jgi:geranylgeranyl diphosphate synthase, type I
MASDLQGLHATLGPPLDREIESWLSHHDSSPFYGMMRYQLGYVDDALAPSSVAGGKRFRPLLCLLACSAAGGEWRDALPAAAGIELLHNFSLIHDDIEDNDPSRRHRPTVWKVWGVPQAINVGDGMFALAQRAVLAAGEDAHTTVRLSSRFAAIAQDLTEGQYLDMVFETRDEVTQPEYLNMIARKTSCLIAFSVWSGACVGAAPEPVLDALQRFGSELGNAFQIHDDIMGIWGEPEQTGKERANDLRNRKKTLPVIEAMSHADGPQRERLRSFLRHESDDVDAVIQVLDAADARRRAERSRDRHRRLALEALATVDLPAESKQTLQNLLFELTGQ